MMYRDEQISYEDPAAHDKPLCFRFGSGAFPCGPVYKVRVTKVDMVNRRSSVRRSSMCRVHYEMTTAGVKGQGSGLKNRVLTAAYQRLAALHLDEFQRLYEDELVKHASVEVPDLDVDLLLPSKNSKES